MSKSMRRLTALALSGAATVLLLLPAASQAATNFGSRLKNDPTETACDVVGPCTIVARVHPSDPNGDPYTGGAPVSGVITKFRTRAFAVDEPGQITFRVANLTLPDPNDRTTPSPPRPGPARRSRFSPMKARSKPRSPR